MNSLSLPKYSHLRLLIAFSLSEVVVLSQQRKSTMRTISLFILEDCSEICFLLRPL